MTLSHLHLPCGIVRGALCHLGVSCIVEADPKQLPCCKCDRRPQGERQAWRWASEAVPSEALAATGAVYGVCGLELYGALVYGGVVWGR